MKILVINSGSSSLKYEIFDMPKNESLARGTIERIGLKGSIAQHIKLDLKTEKKINIKNHEDAIKEVLGFLTIGKNATIKNINEIEAIGHRVVHGGESFSKTTIITKKSLEVINKYSEIAPLHNPANIEGILACKEILGNIPQIAVFDTAFHQNMEKENFLYPIPYKYYQKYKIRKYGFHGISHDYVSKSACKILNLNIKKQKIISCHIGNGASITAIKNGKVIDTSMGMTPLAGLMMGTRCGDIDPAIIEFISKKDYITTEEIGIILNEKSGLLGISETSSDMREILEGENKGDEMSKLAINMYINRIIKYIGSYIALIGGLDILIFTAGIGENSRIIRRKIIKKLGYFNIKLDNKNKKNTGTEGIISDKNSKVKVMVIPTKEEYMIAMETFNILKK